VQRPTQTGLLRTVPVGLGAALGIGIVLTSSDAVRAAPLWWVWAPLAVALTTTGGAIFVYGLDRWAELTSDHPTSARRVAPRIAAIGTIAAVSVVCAQLLLAGPTRGSWRFLALISSFLGAIPAFAVTEGIRLTASEPAPAEPSGAQVADCSGSGSCCSGSWPPSGPWSPSRPWPPARSLPSSAACPQPQGPRRCPPRPW